MLSNSVVSSTSFTSLSFRTKEEIPCNVRDEVCDETLHLLEGIFAWCSPKLEHDEKVPSMNSNAWEVRSVRVHNRREIHL